ncbi:phosphate acyltransferase PlsX [Micromonospora olivasterospora]|uniref:Phosphate acyltransferase n=1 Tax=Micromonospora olivasterospora TaxID=1880 RepID=A0A562ID85_MICOL|nr:phosphate acyltransferase PlsX [Micromonospora olivasterospora]TWH68816.1 phosphate:acyl-[acyl carrier protein] acyltransferase [Micromonospora olivasterospora]
MEPGTARIAVDLLGGDDAPAVVVDGALRAMRADPDLHLLLVGPAEAADEVIGALDPAQRARVTVRPVRSAVGMADHPVAARADSTVRSAVTAVRDGIADAAVSAGATGATVTAAALALGRWPHVRRPALVATLPALAGPVVLLDVGGSLEPGPATLARHALLGAAYAAVAHAVAEPRVGLLSVGTEAGKGDRLRRAADHALAAVPLPCGARYVGFVEGYDLASGTRADVVVTDGFTGNVLLKAIEGAYAMAGGPPASGGAPRAAALLGVAGTVVVCHGAARGEDVASGIALAAHLWRRGATDTVAALLGGAPEAGLSSGDHAERTTDTGVSL